MIADVLLILGLGLLAAAGFMVSVIAGVLVTGVVCIIAGLVLMFGLADGKGFSWRS